MKTYSIEIIETLSRVVEIEADSVENALKSALEKYRNEDIVLDTNDYVDTVIDIFKNI